MEKPEERPASATVVLAQRVRPGAEDEFERWQAGINDAARHFAGFEAAEVVHPVPGEQDDYVTVYRFGDAEMLRTWLDSQERSAWLERGEHLFETEPVQHTIATPRSKTVTVVVTHRVKVGAETAYRTWQRDIAAAARDTKGFVSSEAFEPAGEQPEWVVVFRFDEPRHLQAWLDSDKRAALLERAAPLLESWDMHTISGGLGGWFPVLGEEAGTPPAWKQALVVLLALYPTVMALQLLLTPLLADLPMAVQMLIGNVVSVAALTYLLMPPVTRALRPWLDPNTSARRSALGALAIAALCLSMTAGFWLLG